MSSALARAWQAGYCKPLQTGVAEETGDSEMVAALAGLAPGRIHPPHAILQAPLVVEGAGGLLVPITDEASMIGLAARFGLPVVRSFASAWLVPI